MRRMLSAAALAALLLGATLTPSFAHATTTSSHQPPAMCVRGVQGACNPGLPGWGSDQGYGQGYGQGDSRGYGRHWKCHPIMPNSPSGHPRSHAWVCGWVYSGHH